jgi:hypothetical protein
MGGWCKESRGPPRLVEGLLDVTPHLLQHGLRSFGVAVHRLARALDVDREGDEVLLRTVVEVPLDPAPVGVGTLDESLSRRAELLDLMA